MAVLTDPEWMELWKIRSSHGDTAEDAKTITTEMLPLSIDLAGRRESELHPSSRQFYALLKEIGELHARKSADYGSADDPFDNLRTGAKWGVPVWVGAMLRVTDKIARLQTFATAGDLKNESALDSLLDIAVYCLIAAVLLDEETAGASSS